MRVRWTTNECAILVLRKYNTVLPTSTVGGEGGGGVCPPSMIPMTSDPSGPHFLVGCLHTSSMIWMQSERLWVLKMRIELSENPDEQARASLFEYKTRKTWACAVWAYVREHRHPTLLFERWKFKSSNPMLLRRALLSSRGARCQLRGSREVISQVHRITKDFENLNFSD